MKLTEEEKRLILEKRRYEESGMPKTVGHLKRGLICDCDDLCPWEKCISEHKLKELVTEFRKQCRERTLSKGAMFIGYISYYGETWYDNINYGMENLDSDFAKYHLESIQLFDPKQHKIL